MARDRGIEKVGTIKTDFIYPGSSIAIMIFEEESRSRDKLKSRSLFIAKKGWARLSQAEERDALRSDDFSAGLVQESIWDLFIINGKEFRIRLGEDVTRAIAEHILRMAQGGKIVFRTTKEEDDRKTMSSFDLARPDSINRTRNKNEYRVWFAHRSDRLCSGSLTITLEGGTLVVSDIGVVCV